MPILLLRKHGYHYEYMDEWEKFNEKPLPEKEESYSNLNIEMLRVCKDFEKKIWLNIMIDVATLKATHYYWLMFLKTLEKFVK